MRRDRHCACLAIPALRLTLPRRQVSNWRSGEAIISKRAPIRDAAAFLALLLLVMTASLARAADLPLIAAAKSGDVAVVTRLLAKGGDPDRADPGDPAALNWAAYNGHLAVVRLLVQHHANVDNHANKAGWSPLMNAAARGFADIAAYLIAHRADINAHSGDGGYTPLMYAARKSHLDVVKLLIDRGADINDISDDRRTALMFADQQDDAAIVALISAHGGVRLPAGAPASGN
jgi:ankyrin repeat protein